MFWNSGATSSLIESILDLPNVDLMTILDQGEVIQECKGMNKKLLDFLMKPENIKGMIDLITQEPSEKTSLITQYRYPSIACEILTCDSNFLGFITANRSVLESLFLFFDKPNNSLNPLLASYVCRVICEIFNRKLEQYQNWYSYQLNIIHVLTYLQSETNVLEWLLNHVDTCVVSDLFFKMIMNIEGQVMRKTLYEWMILKENFIPRLMNKMSEEYSKDFHGNVSRLVGDLLYALQDDMSSSSQDRSTDADPFLVALRSEKTISILLSVIFNEESKSSSSIRYGVDMLLALLGITKRPSKQSSRNDSLDVNNDDVVISDSISDEIMNRMAVISNMLKNPMNTQELKLTSGTLKKRLGGARLAIAKLVAHFFTISDRSFISSAIEHGILKQILDLFWEYPENNFLHRYICSILVHIAHNPDSDFITSYILLEYGLLEKLVLSFETKSGLRGYIAKIATAWGNSAMNNEHVDKLFEEVMENCAGFKDRWDRFYNDTLLCYQAQESSLLGGVYPPASNMLNNVSLLYGSDPGVVDVSENSLIADLTASGVDFSKDDYSDDKAKSLFEQYCTHKSFDEAAIFRDFHDDDATGNKSDERENMADEVLNFSDWHPGFESISVSSGSDAPVLITVNNWSEDDLERKLNLNNHWYDNVGEEKSAETDVKPCLEDPWSKVAPMEDPWKNLNSMEGNGGGEKWADFDSHFDDEGKDAKESVVPHVEDVKSEAS